jgi:hypothetical protein
MAAMNYEEQKSFCNTVPIDYCDLMNNDCEHCKVAFFEVSRFFKNKGKPVRAASDARYREKHRKEIAKKNIERYRQDPTTWENYRKDNRETINENARKRYAEKKLVQSTGN